MMKVLYFGFPPAPWPTLQRSCTILSRVVCLTATSYFQRKYSIHYERTAAETFNWHFMLAFSYRNDAVVMLFLCVMENACGNNSSVAGAGKKKPAVSLRIILHVQKWEKKSYKKNIPLKQQLISSISKLARWKRVMWFKGDIDLADLCVNSCHNPSTSPVSEPLRINARGLDWLLEVFL